MARHVTPPRIRNARKPRKNTLSRAGPLTFVPMGQLVAALGVGVVVFASTNVDDILLLAAFFSDPTFTRRQIIAGQFLGIAALLAASAVCASLAVAVPPGWIELLGVAPLALGLRGL